MHCSINAIPQIIRFAKKKKNSLRKYVNTFEFDLPDWSGLGTAVLGLISSTFLILSVKTREEAAANQMFALALGNRVLNVYVPLGNGHSIRQQSIK
jgi:hypothetical protein